MRKRFVKMVAWMAVMGAVGCGNGGGGSTEPPQPGAISGRVGAGAEDVAGASIALSGGATRTATTGATGQFQFDNLSPGSYSLALTVPTGFELAGNETGSKQATVQSGQTATVNWELVVAEEEEGVTEVKLNAASFDPPEVRIKVGETVRFVGVIGDHTVTPDDANQDGVWTGFGLGAGQTREITFESAGTFPYHCVPHLAVNMRGTIIVEN